MALFLCNLGEGSEGKGTLNFAHVVLQDRLRGEGLSEVEAVLNLQTLTHRTLLGAGAHGARGDPLGVADLDPRPSNVAADSLLPQVQVDGRQSGARHPRVQERVGHVEHRPLDVGHPVTVVTGYLCQGDLSDLVQLRFCESDQGVATLVPEPVAFSQISELDANNTRKCWSNQATVQGCFRECACNRDRAYFLDL